MHIQLKATLSYIRLSQKTEGKQKRGREKKGEAQLSLHGWPRLATVGHCPVAVLNYSLSSFSPQGFSCVLLRYFGNDSLFWRFTLRLLVFKIIGTFFFLLINSHKYLIDTPEVWWLWLGLELRGLQAHLVAYWAHPTDGFLKSFSLLVLAALSQAFAVHDAYSCSQALP